MAKGLCYYCDKKYERGHKCQFKEAQLFTVEIPCDTTTVITEEEVEGMVQEEFSDEPCISVNALMGSNTFNTMRVQGWVQGKPIHILIDSGSTHNFLDIKTAQQLGCKKESIGLQAITVADGNHIACQHVVKNFCWKLGGKCFTAEAMLIELGSCDMVLGIQWLSTLGNINWDFKKLIMEFVIEGQKVKLKGIASQKLKVLKGQPSLKLLQNSTQLCLLQLRQVGVSSNELYQLEKSQETSIPDNTNADIHTKLRELKEQYHDIFKEPDQLPPVRGLFDHRIPLEVGSNPVSIRPYRYPLKQRDIIENIIEEMLQKGIIQQSASPFASPVVLVGKKDGSWRLCVDYRELNKRTVKDKFPIPVVDELIDELSGSRVFSKIDLRAGYHQLRMHTEDVFKTAFKTHSGHYEFLVMPFGLTNAPASFQGWMNAIFKQFLRKSVLVFFDDILIYSKSLEDHWCHLQQVFELMRHHSLFAKDSKCCFVMDKHYAKSGLL